MKSKRDPTKWYLMVRVPMEWHDPIYQHTDTTINQTILQAIRSWLRRRHVQVDMPRDQRTERFRHKQ